MGQLYYKNLHSHFFDLYPRNATKFICVSGYLGPDPVRKMHAMPFESQIIFGLQRETPNPPLHEQLTKNTRDNVTVFYPDTASHAKCYVWLENDKPIRGLVGSANFSTNGLFNDYRETLIEVEKPDLHSVLGYINIILESAKICTEFNTENFKVHKREIKETCEMILYDPRDGEVQQATGLNWGFANANVTPNDASIPIRVSHIRESPNLFQPVFFKPESGHRGRKQNESVEIIWDDGVVMEALFEGSQPVDGVLYPKQICSVPRKNLMGEYFRGRLQLPLVSNNKNASERITRAQLERYGRNFITLSLIQPGIYSADFSNSSQKPALG